MPIYKRGKKYWIDVSAPDGTRIRRSAGTEEKSKAQQLHDKIKHELWAVENLDKRPEKLFEDLVILALRDAASEVQATVGALDIAWGDIARLRRGKTDLPGNGAGTALGVFREIVYEPDEDGKFKSSSGDTYIALVEFSQPVRAQVLITYGNATQSNTFETGDQLYLAAQQQLRPAWRTLEEIKANLVMSERLIH